MKVQMHKLMKTTTIFLCLILLGFSSAGTLRADPHITSWFTTYSGRYARIYTSDTAKTNGASVTTWTNGTTIQSSPAYCGVQEIDSSSNWVYIRSSGLASFVMGPWYLDSQHTQNFPNWPINEKVFYRIPRSPSVPSNHTSTGGGPIGYFVDGAAMFNSWDAYYWNGSSDVQAGGGAMGYWNRDAYVNEGPSFDPNNAHQANGQYHYHVNPPALRYLLGDHIVFNPTNKFYLEDTTAPTKHSPLLGWVADGYPIYGPYGYSTPMNPASGVRRMISGYVLRNGQMGTQNLTSVGRTSIPAWAARLYNVSSNQSGPTVSASYPLGRYMEDNDYLGDLGYTQGVNFDLDEFNGRFCVTPEYPNGTYAYFVSISSNGTPVFPYNIGRGYYGTPSGGNVTTLAETVITNFLGGPNLPPVLKAPKISGGMVTLTWSATEGGTYLVASTTNMSSWTTNTTNVSAVLDTGGYTNSSPENQKFFRVARTALAAYDPVSGTGSTGGGSNSVAPGGSASRGTTVTVTIALPTTPPQPPANNVPTSVTLAGSITGTSIQKPSQGTVIATFAIPANAPTGAQNIVIVFNPAPTYTMTGAFTIN